MNQNTVPKIDWRAESGPLRVLLNDADVSEIMINRWDLIFVERKGVIEQSQVKFPSPDALDRFAQAASVAIGRELNRRVPYMEGAFPDGTRLTIVMSPIAVDGTSITVRKPSYSTVSYKDLIAKGTLNDKMVYFLHQVVMCKQNVIVSGGTGSGKTTLLSVLSSFIGNKERVITMEDTPELQVQVANNVRLETRPPLATEPPIEMRDLLKGALRMRPDRIIIGECRGAEAFDMLMAMNTGHSGSMTTVHANSTEDALRRLESMILRSSAELPHDVIQNDIANTIDFVIQIERNFEGKRRITQITEVVEANKSGYQTIDIFNFSDEDGHRSTGAIPAFVEKKLDPRMKFPSEFFNPEKQIALGSAS